MYPVQGLGRMSTSTSQQSEADKMGGDSKVETISRLAQWRLGQSSSSSSSSYYKKSEPFKMGIWNWHLSIERNRCLYIRLFPEPSRVSKEQPPFARFFLTLSNGALPHKPVLSPIQERPLRNSDDFVWPVDIPFYGRFIIHVEFLDLKICSLSGGEGSSIWPSYENMQSLASQSALQTMSRMLNEGIHADVTIKTADGNLKGHKAILSASSRVFGSMFVHDLREKESSTIEIEDMNWESCMALLSYLYGTIKADDFWKNRLALLGAANKYDIRELKEACEESLVQDINTGNVLERLQEAWLYKLEKLKKGCMAYLFEFGKIYEVRDEMSNFFGNSDRELLAEMFQEVVTVWKPA